MCSAVADHDGVEVVRVVEDAPEVVELLGLRIPLGRGVHGILVHVAEDDDVLGRNARGGPDGAAARALLAGDRRRHRRSCSRRARPPQAMNAMFSLLFRFWPRRKAGAPVIMPAAARACRQTRAGLSGALACYW